MNKLISITTLLGLCLAMPAQAVPMSQKLATLKNQPATSGIATQSGDRDTTVTQVRSVSPGMRIFESTLVTQAMTPPSIDNLVVEQFGPIAEIIQEATSSVAGIGIDLDLDLPALPDNLVDFSDAGDFGMDTDRIVTTEPATLLLLLAGFLALFARRR